MALQEIDGGNFIDRIFSKVQTGENFIFDSYLPLSSMKFEKWDSQLYDDDSFVTNNLWKSSQGSSIAFTKSSSYSAD